MSLLQATVPESEYTKVLSCEQNIWLIPPVVHVGLTLCIVDRLLDSGNILLFVIIIFYCVLLFY